MERLYAPAVIMLMLFSAAMTVVATSEDSDATSEEYTIEGYIGEIGDSEWVPVPNVLITIYDQDDEEAGHGLTDTTGKYSIDVTFDSSDPLDNLRFECEKNGYDVYGLQPCFSRNTDGEIYLDLSELTPVSGVYTLAADMFHCISISKTYIDVLVNVSGVNSTLKNVKVSLYVNGGKVESETTNDDGKCTFKDLSIGTYKAVLECNGYKSCEEMIEVNKGSAQFSFTMEENELVTYYGMTAYHILMIVGVAIGLILVVVAYILSVRNWKDINKVNIDE